MLEDSDRTTEICKKGDTLKKEARRELRSVKLQHNAGHMNSEAYQPLLRRQYTTLDLHSWIRFLDNGKYQKVKINRQLVASPETHIPEK